jgi:hypothetical protein
MASGMLALLLIVVQLASIGVSGFNLEVEDVVVHRGPRDSMFGFSVAMHVARDERGTYQGWLVENKN